MQAALHVSVCGFNELHKRRGIGVASGPEFHMAHELASALQQTLRIGNLRTPKESDIDVRFERIHIPECRIGYTCGRMAIMQQLSNVVSASSHDRKPLPCDHPQFAGMLM